MDPSSTETILSTESLRIVTGSYREAAFSNPTLGDGTLIVEAIISVSHMSGAVIEVIPGVVYLPEFGQGKGVYRMVLEIDSGTYEGTLEGTSSLEWAWDISSWDGNLPTFPFHFNNWGTARLHEGMDACI